MADSPGSLHFVISAPRSGSTWLAQALGGHPEIFATENRLFGDFCEIWSDNQGARSPRITFDAYARAFSRHCFVEKLGLSRPGFQEAFLTDYLHFLSSFLRRRSGKQVIVDKITPYLGTSDKVLDRIKTLLPNSKIIHLLRDGRDVATSGVFDWLAREPVGSDRYRFFVSREPGFTLSRFFDDESMEKWARYWNEPQAACEAAGNAFEVRYEDMLVDQSSQLLRIFEYLEVTADQGVANACAEGTSFLRKTGRQPGTEAPTDKARKGVVGDWKNYFTRADGRFFHELVGPRLMATQYVSSQSWFNDLPASLDLR